MPEITRRFRIGKILTFFIDERVFNKLENRFGMIMGRNIKSMSFSRWMAMVPFVSCLSIFDSTRKAELYQGFLALVLEKV